MIRNKKKLPALDKDEEPRVYYEQKSWPFADGRPNSRLGMLPSNRQAATLAVTSFC